MFYLRESFNILKKNFFLTSALGVLTFILYFSVANFTQVQKIISSKLPEIENAHYFNALVSDGVNIISVKRKIEGLPGVKEVSLLNEKDSLNKLKSLTSALELSQEEFNTLKSMVAIKITLNAKVSQSSIKLIREYMVRLTGKSNILMGGVKYKISNEKVYKSLIANIKQWPLHISTGIFFSFWLVVFSLLRKEILKVSYIIESFQRKENVAIKIYLTLLTSILIVSAIGSLLFFMPQWSYAVVFSVILLLFPASLFGKKDWVKA